MSFLISRVQVCKNFKNLSRGVKENRRSISSRFSFWALEQNGKILKSQRIFKNNFYERLFAETSQLQKQSRHLVKEPAVNSAPGVNLFDLSLVRVPDQQVSSIFSSPSKC
jgi:hypothetical protein